MPLRDHFHPPWIKHNYWESFHFEWISTLVRHLNGTLLPKQYRALPEVHLNQNVFELRIYEESRGHHPVGALEIVSPANKDRPESRQAFVNKCAGYLQQGVGLIIVDIVTSRRGNFHHELQKLLAPVERLTTIGDLYAVAYRDQRGASNGHSRLGTWPATLEIGKLLPTLPLWLTDGPAIPIDLEVTYEETARVLRVE